MRIIDKSLRYLSESLSNYLEKDEMSKIINNKLEQHEYETEIDFVEELEDEEIDYLNALLEREINYARSVQDDVREKELNDIYELLF